MSCLIGHSCCFFTRIFSSNPISFEVNFSQFVYLSLYFLRFIPAHSDLLLLLLFLVVLFSLLALSLCWWNASGLFDLWFITNSVWIINALSNRVCEYWWSQKWISIKIFVLCLFTINCFWPNSFKKVEPLTKKSNKTEYYSQKKFVQGSNDRRNKKGTRKIPSRWYKERQRSLHLFSKRIDSIWRYLSLQI